MSINKYEREGTVDCSWGHMVSASAHAHCSEETVRTPLYKQKHCEKQHISQNN